MCLVVPLAARGAILRIARTENLLDFGTNNDRFLSSIDAIFLHSDRI
jgi:hypothetical protein